MVSDQIAVMPPPGKVDTGSLHNGSEGFGNTADGTLQMVWRPDGSPRVSLSLVLIRQPATQENIRGLIQSGVLAFDLKLAAGQKNQLFARQVRYQLFWNDHGQWLRLAESESSGTEARAAFAVNLNQEQSLDALSALQDLRPAFLVKAIGKYRRQGVPGIIKLSGSWHAIYQFIQQYSDFRGIVTWASLQALIPDGRKAADSCA